jgi:hypothetical protein
LAQDTLDETSFEITATSWYVTDATVTLDPHVTAFTAARDHGHPKAPQFTQQLAAGHLGNYTFTYINRATKTDRVR